MPFLYSWRTKLEGLLPLGATCPPQHRASPLSRATLWWGPPSQPPLLGFLVAAGTPRSSDHSPQFVQHLRRCWLNGGLATMPTMFVAMRGDRMPCALAVPAGLGRTEAWSWAWQARLGPVSPVALGYSAAWVNSDFFFIFVLIQIKSNPIQFRIQFKLKEFLYKL
jgi:hypothetical protein